MTLLILACTASEPQDSAPPAEDSAAPEDTAAPAPSLDGLCPLDDRLGAFYVEAYERYSAVYGEVRDGVVPNTILSELSVEGACRLMRTENPYCKPACQAGETCDLDGTCVPYPETQDLGTVTVAGLVEEVVMEPVSPGYSYFDTSLPHPAFAAGATVELRTEGGAFTAFTLHGLGFELLDPDGVSWTVAEGEPVPVSWTAGGEDTEVFVELNVDQHGSSPITVWCLFPDDGEAEIPASVVDALLDAGVTGYPSGAVTRRTSDHAPVGEGCVDLAVASPRSVSVDVAGYTPCTSDLDCPPDQDCNLDLQVCE